MEPCERSERIEQIFQRVEEETERRARAQALAEAEAVARSPPTGNGSASPSTPSTTPATRLARERRRGSVSVSRFGQSTDPSLDGLSKLPDAPAPVASYVVRKPTFYQAQVHATSADSLASLPASSSLDPSARLDAPDETQVIQMATFAGRSISKAFSRRLSRSKTRSRDVLVGNGGGGLMIGVKVEEATVNVDGECEGEGEAEEGAGVEGEREGKAGRPRAGTTVAFVQGALKEKASRVSMGGCAEKEKGWRGKAKELTMKLRRRSMGTIGGAGAGASPR